MCKLEERARRLFRRGAQVRYQNRIRVIAQVNWLYLGTELRNGDVYLVPLTRKHEKNVRPINIWLLARECQEIRIARSRPSGPRETLPGGDLGTR